MRLIEPFAGAAGVSLRALGLHHALCPYLGSKRRYADIVLRLIGRPKVESVWLNDAGYIGQVWRDILDPEYPAQERMRQMVALGDGTRDMYRRVAARVRADGMPLALGRGEAAHEWLWCAARSFRPGFPATGWNAPANVVEQARRVTAVIALRERITVTCFSASRLPWAELGDGDVVYLDPPYPGTTGYDVRVAYGAVVAMAEQARENGAIVAVSGSYELPESFKGWTICDITEHRTGGSAPGGDWNCREFLALSHPPPPGALPVQGGFPWRADVSPRTRRPGRGRRGQKDSP